MSSLADETNQSMTAVVDQALAAFERQRFFEAFNDGYRRLRGDERAWSEIEAERDAEAGAISDTGS